MRNIEGGPRGRDLGDNRYPEEWGQALDEYLARQNTERSRLDYVMASLTEKKESLSESMKQFRGIDFIFDSERDDYRVGFSELAPNLQVFADRIVHNVGKSNKHHLAVIEGLPGNLKTTAADKLSQYLETALSLERWKNEVRDKSSGAVEVFGKGNTNVRVFVPQWDKTERILMRLASPSEPRSIDEIGLNKESETSLELEEEILGLHQLITEIITSGKWEGQQISDEFLGHLRFIMQASQDYLDKPFDLAKPYPVGFMKATDLLMQFITVSSLAKAENKGQIAVVVVDKLGGTGGLRGHTFVDLRGYGSGFLIKLKLGYELFSALNPKRLELYGISATVEQPYPITLGRMLMMLASSLDEAKLVLKIMNIPNPFLTVKEWERMKTGGMFAHIREAEKQAWEYLSTFFPHGKKGVDRLIPAPDYVIDGMLMDFDLEKDVLNEKTSYFPLYLGFLADIYGKMRMDNTSDYNEVTTYQIRNFCLRLMVPAYYRSLFDFVKIPPENTLLMYNSLPDLFQHLMLNEELFKPLFRMMGTVKTERQFRSKKFKQTVFDWLRKNESKFVYAKKDKKKSVGVMQIID